MRTESVRIIAYVQSMTTTTNTSTGSSTFAGAQGRWKALGVLSLVQFMLVLDITVVNVALPHIRSSLGFSESGLAWVVDAYVLMAGGLLLLGGRLADLLGRRRMFLAGVALFAVASAASGAATSPAMLIASRFAQGTAEALAAPAAFGLIALLFPEPTERAKAIGVFGGVAGLGGTLGPVISGLIVEGLDWRWIFFVNIPVAAAALITVPRLVAESRAAGARQGRPDVAGALVGTAALASSVYGLIEAATLPWGSPHVVVPLAAGAVLLALFAVRERTASNPLVPRRFFTNRTRVAANAVTICFASVFFSYFFLLTLYLQQVDHYSALHTGIAYLPFGAVIGAGIGISTRILPRVGVRAMLAAGFLLAAAGMAAMSGIAAGGSYLTELLPGMVLMALGSGLAFAGLSNASVHGVSGEDASLASGVQSAVQQVGGAIGLAVLATLALRRATSAAHHGTALAVASSVATDDIFRVGAAILLVGALATTAFFERAAGRTGSSEATTADAPLVPIAEPVG